MRVNLKNIDIDIDRMILSSRCRVYKTENLIKQTRYIADMDFFLSKLSEGIICNIDKFSISEHSRFHYLVETLDKSFIFLFLLERGDSSQGKRDIRIIFFDFKSCDDDIRQNDQRVVKYLKENKSVRVNIESIEKDVETYDFQKLYVVSNGSNINLPLLSSDQKRIVETMDEHVVVQGVAGSGKTNVCIDKLIFSACRNYSGKVLYTTYSRGLLNNTKLKIEAYKNELISFVNMYERGLIKFLDNNHKKALENKFGVYFFSDDDDKIIEKIKHIIYFLSERVDYHLIDDIYKKYIDKNVIFVGENYFVHNYIQNLKNHQIRKELKKLEVYSAEIIYKEIYGIIFGFFDERNPQDIISLNDYLENRKDSFSLDDCRSIYMIAKDYLIHCRDNNLMDVNLASKELINNRTKIDQYSLSIIDEVQDYTQVNLNLIKNISLKLFCVGDALQMINPSYFSFGYLKNLLYEKDIISVAELKNNYRNTKKIEEIIEALGNINIRQFGTHNFVLKGSSVDSNIKTEAIYVSGTDLIEKIAKGKYDNFTIVVANKSQKEALKKIITNQEVLTVSEIKGLERDTVILLNLLSSNQFNWQRLEKATVNRKQADENSIYRYYFNLFYVGVSRAKQNLFVIESCDIPLFNDLFKKHFDNFDAEGAIGRLNKIVSKLEYSENELVSRVREFISLEQYDNAIFIANKIADDKLRIQELNRIDVNRQFVSRGNYRGAGIKFWELGLLQDAKKQFVLSNDDSLIKLIEACESSEGANQLNVDIVEYYDDVKNNDIAKNLILDTLKKDLKALREDFGSILDNLVKKKRK